jgi:hypothetical protein
MAGLAAFYAGLASIALVVPFWTIVGVWIMCAVVVGFIALPLAFHRLNGFRTACVAVAVLLVPLGIVGAIAGMFVYWPAALPLALAATPLPDRFPATTILMTTLLLAIPWMTSPLWL